MNQGNDCGASLKKKESIKLSTLRHFKFMKKKQVNEVWENHTLLKISRVMKLTFGLLLILMVQGWAINSYSQKVVINLDVKNADLIKVLDKIEEQTDFYFLFNYEQVNSNRKLNVKFSNSKIEEVLNKILEGTDLNYSIKNRQIIITKDGSDTSGNTQTKSSVQQLKSVSGKVTDSSGQLLPGVTIVLKGTSMGIVTDLNGTFSLSNIPDNSVLIFSFVGMKSQEIAINGKSVINVTMQEEAVGLDEVVAVGYGTQKKVNLTGAVSQVTAKQLENRPINSVTQMLQGTIPNVSVNVGSGSPGTTGSISIRGLGSINSNSPLILIDGIPGNMESLDPAQVKSISVLKDASSAAIYGARAAFGVVLITTKEADSKKTEVSYNGYAAFSQPTVSTDFITNGYEYATLYDRSRFGRNGTPNSVTSYTEEDYAELEARRYDKTENPDRPWVAVKNGKYNYYGNVDWWKWMYKDWMPSQSHSISISGGNEKVKSVLTATFYQKEGMIKRVDEKYQTFNISSKVSVKVNNWISISNHLQYFDRVHAYPGEDASNAAFARTTLYCAPMYVPIGPDGNYTGLMKTGKILAEGRVANLYGGVSKGQDGLRNFKETFSFDLTPLKDLIIKADYTYMFSMDNNWKRQGLVYVSNGTPGGLRLTGTSAFGSDWYQKNMTFNPSHIVNAYATYNKNISKHSLSATLGVNYENNKASGLYGKRDNLISESLNDLNLAIGSNIVATGGAYQTELFGLFFRANYNFNERYLLEFNGRYDGTSRFRSGDRFGFFPSVSGAWRVSEENWFMPLKSIFDNLKIRSSYGMLGNQEGVATYPYSVMYQSLSGYMVDGSKAYYLTSPAPVSDNMTWEKTATRNFGVDATILKNRLSISGDFYIRKTTDMLVKGVTLPQVFGADSPNQNAGVMETRGIEISINWSDNLKLAGKPLSYNISASFGDATSKITKYQGNDNGLIFNDMNNMQNVNYYTGKVGEIWGFKTDGLFQSDQEAASWGTNQTYVNQDIVNSKGDWSKLRAGDVKYVDLDGDKKITVGQMTLKDHGDLKVIGNTTPRYNYSFGGNVNWNRIDFSVFFQGIGKRDFYANKEMDKFWGTYGRVNNTFVPVSIAGKAWSEDNKGGYFPQIERGDAAYTNMSQLQVYNDRYLQNIGYLRLKNLTVGYSFSGKWMQKAHLSKFRLYVSGENLFYWSPFTKYIDPEQAMASIDARIYPFSRTFSFGVNANF